MRQSGSDCVLGRFGLAREPGTSEASPLRETGLANSHFALPVKPSVQRGNGPSYTRR
jgi:hypothetical protein